VTVGKVISFVADADRTPAEELARAAGLSRRIAEIEADPRNPSNRSLGWYKLARLGAEQAAGVAS
jgi:hypothetical protein